MFDENKVIETLTITISKAIKHFINQAKFDITKTGIIIDVLDINEYSIMLDGAEYRNVFCSIEQNFIKGDRILALIMRGNYKDIYIIGRAR